MSDQRHGSRRLNNPHALARFFVERGYHMEISEPSGYDRCVGEIRETFPDCENPEAVLNEVIAEHAWANRERKPE